MSNTARSSMKDQPSPIDPTLQSKLVAKFGAKLMQQGFTALPNLVEDYYRYVPGRPLPKEVIDSETGEVKVVEAVSYMTPTEHAIMIAIWTFWWTDQNDPWPSVEQICRKVRKSERQVRRYLQRLRDKGFMVSLEQYNSEGKQISNRYDFTPFLKRLLSYLDELEKKKAPDEGVHPTSRGDKKDGECLSRGTGSGCQMRQANQIESESESPDEEDSDSSGSAAGQKGTVLFPPPAYSHIAHGTIGSTEEETKVPNEVESSRTSNPPSASEKLAGGARAKGVNIDGNGKKPSRWEEFALASGVPLDRLSTLETWMQSSPRPQVPLLVQAIIDPISERFGNGRFLVSNRTQAAKLYWYARKEGMTQDELEDAFREWVHSAFIHIPPHVEKKMAWFFRALKVEVLRALTERSAFYPPTRLAEAQPGQPEQLDLQQNAPSAEDSAGGSVEDCHLDQPTREIVLNEDEAELGWEDRREAQWCVKKLLKDLARKSELVREEEYEYEILPTQYGRWGVEIRRRRDQAATILLTREEMYRFRAQEREERRL